MAVQGGGRDKELFPERVGRAVGKDRGRNACAPVVRDSGRRVGERRLRGVERMWWRVDGDNRDGKQPPVGLGIVS